MTSRDQKGAVISTIGYPSDLATAWLFVMYYLVQYFEEYLCRPYCLQSCFVSIV